MRPLNGVKLRRNTMHDEGNNDWGGDKKTLEYVILNCVDSPITYNEGNILG